MSSENLKKYFFKGRHFFNKLKKKQLDATIELMVHRSHKLLVQRSSEQYFLLFASSDLKVNYGSKFLCLACLDGYLNARIVYASLV